MKHLFWEGKIGDDEIRMEGSNTEMAQKVLISRKVQEGREALDFQEREPAWLRFKQALRGMKL